MLTAVVLVVTHVVAAAAGAVGWVHLSPLVAKFTAGRAVSSAQKLVAKAKADAAALAAAEKLVAAQPKPAASGPTGA